MEIAKLTDELAKREEENKELLLFLEGDSLALLSQQNGSVFCLQ